MRTRRAVTYTLGGLLLAACAPFYGAGIASLMGFGHLSWTGRLSIGVPFVAIFGYLMHWLWVRSGRGEKWTALQEFSYRWLLYFVLAFVIHFAERVPTAKDYRDNTFLALALASMMALFTTRSLMTRPLFGRRQKPIPPPVQLP